MFESSHLAASCIAIAVIDVTRRSPTPDPDNEPDSVAVQLIVDPLVLGVPQTALSLPLMLFPVLALVLAVCVPIVRWQFSLWTRERGQQHRQ